MTQQGDAAAETPQTEDQQWERSVQQLTESLLTMPAAQRARVLAGLPEERTLTCVYCGHAYPPGTPDHGAEVLTAHIAQCEKHPMREVVRQRDQYLALLENASPDGEPFNGGFGDGDEGSRVPCYGFVTSRGPLQLVKSDEPGELHQFVFDEDTMSGEYHSVGYLAQQSDDYIAEVEQERDAAQGRLGDLESALEFLAKRTRDAIGGNDPRGSVVTVRIVNGKADGLLEFARDMGWSGTGKEQR